MNYTISFEYLFIGVILSSFILYETIEKRRGYKWKLLICYIFLLSISFIFPKVQSYFINGNFQKMDISSFHETYYGGKGIDVDWERHYISINKTENNKPNYILTGDSFARQYGNYIKNKGIIIEGAVSDGHFSLEGISNNNTQLQETTRKFLMNKYPDIPIIIAYSSTNAYQLYENGIKIPIEHNKQKFINALDDFFLQNKNHKFYLIGLPNSDSNFSSLCLMRKNSIYNKIIHPKDTCSRFISMNTDTDNYNQLLNNLSLKYSNVFYIDPNIALCKSKSECMVIDANGNPIFSDMHHLSIWGTDIVGKYIFDEIDKIENSVNSK